MEQRIKEAKKVTWIGFFCNLLLSIAKFLAGLIGHSTAMLADGIHSLSDFISDIVVLTFINVSGREGDEDHHYGHGKFETFATMIVSVVLLAVGIGIFWNGLHKVILSFKGVTIAQPSSIALWAALVSIASKEILFRYTVKIGKIINSPAVIANGWHHRSDALSSIGTALGISGAMFLGEQWRILDPLAGIIVSLFIAKISLQLAWPSINELLEAALPKEVEKEIINIIIQTDGVRSYHRLKTRKIGSIFAIDVHIQLDRNITFVKSHDIATDIEKKLRRKYGKRTQISIHTEPLGD